MASRLCAWLRQPRLSRPMLMMPSNSSDDFVRAPHWAGCLGSSCATRDAGRFSSMALTVLDASIALAWCFDDETSSATEALLDEIKVGGAVVPTLWHVELGNVLLAAERG